MGIGTTDQTIGVAGLWHLGTVTSACLAAAGCRVVAFDEQPRVVAELAAGRPPLFEPGLEALVAKGLAAGRLRFTTSPMDLKSCEMVWITYDTPVDEQDRADVEGVLARVTALLPWLRPSTLVIVSSQLPVGTIRRLETTAHQLRPGDALGFACLPENLVLGRAIEAFTHPERIVVGVRSASDGERLAAILQPFTDRIEWMSVESAEMTKHALNAFLATSVVFANEVALLCEHHGADAKEVERGLRTDVRVGPRAYVRPGPAFAGGTLARDVSFLVALGASAGLPVHLLPAVLRSNAEHQRWPQRRLGELLGDLHGKPIAVLGLTYKPGTDTLRRSMSIQICRWLHEQGALVSAYDPAIKALPADLVAIITLGATAEAALTGSMAALVMTEWPEFRSISGDDLYRWMTRPLVLDAGRFLERTLETDKRVQYVATGMPA